MKTILSSISRSVVVTSLLALAAGSGCANGTNPNGADSDLEDGDTGTLQPKGGVGGDSLAFVGGTGGAGASDPGFTPDPADQGWSEEVSTDALALTSVSNMEYAKAYVIRGSNGVANVPLDQDIKDEMLTELKNTGDENTVFMVSPKALADIAEAKATGKLSDDLIALSDGDGPVLLGSCSDQLKTATKSLPLSFSTSGSQDFGGGFSGNYSFSASVTGSVNAALNYRVKRTSVFGFCVPYMVTADNVHLYGSMQAQQGDGIEGTLGGSFKWSREVAKPGLGALVFMVGPVPVVVGFSLPITVGLDATASGTGTLHLQGQSVYASGSFDYTCTFSGCSGSGGFSMPTPGQPNLAAGISGRVQADAWVDASVRAYLYSDSVAYAQIGGRPHLYGDLWAYYGNDCGDANGDGVNETVSAATFDLDWQVMLTAKAGVGGGSQLDKPDLWHTQRRLIKFWDLLGNSSALTPMVQGPASPKAGVSATYTVKMRPCYPYQADAANGLLMWGDGGGTGATTPGSKAHTYASAGFKGMTYNVSADSFGRNFGSGKTTSRTINVAP